MSNRQRFSLEGVTLEQLTRAILCAGVSYAAASGIMLRYELIMREQGGGGINSLSMAGNAENTSRIIDRWGARGVVAARKSLYLDFGYICSYTTLSLLLGERARRQISRSKRNPSLSTTRILCAVAASADIAEGMTLLKLLNSGDRIAFSQWARPLAIVKFAALAGLSAYCATAEVTSRFASGLKSPEALRVSRTPASSIE